VAVPALGIHIDESVVVRPMERADLDGVAKDPAVLDFAHHEARLS
jgi:hypothetical protein